MCEQVYTKWNAFNELWPSHSGSGKQLVVMNVSMYLNRVCVWAAFKLPVISFHTVRDFSIQQRFQWITDGWRNFDCNVYFFTWFRVFSISCAIVMIQSWRINAYTMYSTLTLYRNMFWLAYCRLFMKKALFYMAWEDTKIKVLFKSKKRAL